MKLSLFGTSKVLYGRSIPPRRMSLLALSDGSSSTTSSIRTKKKATAPAEPTPAAEAAIARRTEATTEATPVEFVASPTPDLSTASPAAEAAAAPAAAAAAAAAAPAATAEGATQIRKKKKKIVKAVDPAPPPAKNSNLATYAVGGFVGAAGIAAIYLVAKKVSSEAKTGAKLTQQTLRTKAPSTKTKFPKKKVITDKERPLAIHSTFLSISTLSLFRRLGCE